MRSGSRRFIAHQWASPWSDFQSHVLKVVEFVSGPGRLGEFSIKDEGFRFLSVSCHDGQKQAMDPPSPPASTVPDVCNVVGVVVFSVVSV